MVFDGKTERHTVLELPVRGVHGEIVAELPRVTRTHFDRLLIAQARVEGLVFITHDEAIARSEVPSLRV